MLFCGMLYPEDLDGDGKAELPDTRTIRVYYYVDEENGFAHKDYSLEENYDRLVWRDYAR